jgi:hypothetical protein
MFILIKASLLVLIINIDASATQSPNPIFLALAIRFPKRFNSLFALRISP